MSFRGPSPPIFSVTRPDAVFSGWMSATSSALPSAAAQPRPWPGFSASARWTCSPVACSTTAMNSERVIGVFGRRPPRWSVRMPVRSTPVRSRTRATASPRVSTRSGCATGVGSTGAGSTGVVVSAREVSHWFWASGRSTMRVSPRQPRKPD